MTKIIFIPLMFISCQLMPDISKEGSLGFKPKPLSIQSTLTDYMDKLNLQSDSAQNFVLSGSSITTWIDKSSSANNATQPTSTKQPTLIGGVPTFDGVNDYLQLANEISVNDFSVYIVAKRISMAGNRAFISSSTVNTNYFIGNGNETFWVNFSSGTLKVETGAMKNTNVYSFRRSGNTFTVKVNDRTALILGTVTVSSPNILIGLIGRIFNGLYSNCAIRSVCVSSTALTDTEDAEVREELYARYNLPSEIAIIGFGDSNVSTTTWLDKLGVAQSLGTVDLGISGSTLTSGGGKPGSGINRYQSQIVTRNYNDIIIIMYGTNDVKSGVPSSAISTDLTTIVNSLVSQGYPAQNIILTSTLYQKANLYAAQLDLYRTAILGVATSLGTKYVDALQLIRDNGGDVLMKDPNHLNPAGDDIIVTAIQAVL